VTRTRKPSTRRAMQSPDPLPQPPVIGESPVAALALECWRINKLIPEFKNIRKHLILQTSVDRMIDTLKGLGVAIEDPEGSEFRDGMTMSIAAFDHSDQVESGKRVVSLTLSPNIYIHQKLARPARVIVSVGKKDGSHGT
jgi:hypothetical protein